MSLVKLIKDFESLFYEDIVRRKKTTPFLVFVFLLITFFLSRVFVIYFPQKVFFIRGYHIHHFFFGVILLGVAGYVALVSDKIRLQRLAAAVFGTGLGLVLDETGLFLTCGTLVMECDYWAKVTYDIFILIASLFMAILYFEPFWRRMGKTILGLFTRFFKFIIKIFRKK
jgi:hypothetical protein